MNAPKNNYKHNYTYFKNCNWDYLLVSVFAAVVAVFDFWLSTLALSVFDFTSVLVSVFVFDAFFVSHLVSQAEALLNPVNIKVKPANKPITFKNFTELPPFLMFIKFNYSL
jgi:hypothetical protein